MAQRQFASGDTSRWADKYGTGSAGSYSTSGNLTDSSRTGYSCTTFAGTEGQTSGTAGAVGNFVAGDLILIHQSRNGGDGAGVWELNKISSTGTGANWTLNYALTHDYATTAQVYRLVQYSDVTIGSGHTLTGDAWNGTTGGIVAFLAKESITVTGTITVKGKGYRGATTFRTGAGTIQDAGEGTTGAETQTQSANGNAGGGGRTESGAGANNASVGGGGGNVSAGEQQSAHGSPAYTGGEGGAIAGNSGLTVMVFGGSSGRAGSVATDYTEANSCRGFNGGGIVLLISKVITVSGGINAEGEDNTNSGYIKNTPGAGGSVLLKGQTLTLGTSKISANRGSILYGTVVNSSHGRIHADYSKSISGTTAPTIDSALDKTLANTAGGAFLFNFL